MTHVLRLAWYRLRAGGRRRAASYLGVVLLIGLVGGVAMAAVAGARRTDSSFETFVASTHPSTVGVFTAYDDPGLGLTTGYRSALEARVAKLPLVVREADAVIFDGNIDLSSVEGFHLQQGTPQAPPTILGSADGEFTTMDRVSILSGSLPGHQDAHAVMINVQAARQLRLHVGSVLGSPFYTDAQLASPLNFPPHWVTVTVSGEFVASRDVLESDFSALNSATVMFSPALTRDLESHYATATETFLQTKGGIRTAKQVIGEVVGVDPIAGHFPSEITNSFVPVAQGAITPESVALGLFGGIAGVAALLLGALLIAREVRTRGDDLDALRAVGADRLMLVGDEVVGMWSAVLVGALVAVVVALSLSPLTPIGPVRSVYPERGVAIDGVVLGFGFLILVGVLCAITALVTMRAIQRRTVTSVLSSRPRVGRMRAASALSLPLSMDTGLRFATEAGRGRGAAPIRFAMLGSVLAVTVLVASVTFEGSLNNLVSHPPLYGWNWNYALLASFAGAEDLPGPEVASLLYADHDVQTWSGVNLASASFDGQRVQVMTERPGVAVAPPLLAGHGLLASNEIDLGPATLALFHKRIGDAVMLDNGAAKRLRLVIVGTVTMPALGQGDGQGTGAVVATSDFPTALLNLQDATVPGPNAVLIRLRPDLPQGAGLASLRRINAAVNRLPASRGLGGGVIGVLRPVGIVDFHSMGTTPAILSGGLALGAIVALGLTLSASMRRKRRELALLKSLGFSRRQLSASVAWMATAHAIVGIVVGIPIGVVIGRQLWLRFARSISVVPEAVAPITVLLAIAGGAILFANLVAVLPGRAAARTSTAIVLHAE